MYSFHHIALSVSDIEKSISFYKTLEFRQVLAWQAEDKSLRIVHLKNKQGFVLELFCYVNPKQAPDTIHATSTDLPIIGTKHFGLQVGSINAARQNLIKVGLVSSDIEIVQGRTGILYFFISDPDGILVEIVEDKRNL